jgi:AraC-like DNA-binding protein
MRSVDVPARDPGAVARSPITLARAPTLVTTDPDTAHRWMQTITGARRPRLRDDHSDFTFDARARDLTGFSSTRVRYSAAADLVVPARRVLLVAHVFEGTYGYDNGSHDTTVPGGQVLLVPHHQDVTIAWDGLDVGAMGLVAADVERIAHEISGMDPAALRFAGGRPISVEAAEHWRATVAYVNRTIACRPGLAADPIVAAEASRLLAVTLLSTFVSTMSTYDPLQRREDVAPAALRRAVSFIEDNAGRAITLSDIAAAARTGPRGLQYAFRRTLDTTPLAYLSHVRLDGAHRELLAADPSEGNTVRSIAARWGFTHPGRFASLYRKTFAETPGRTLRS